VAVSTGWGRPIRKGDVRSIGANFDPDLLGIVVVWERTTLPVGGGRYCTLDGQHRVRSILDVLQWYDQKIECHIYTDINAQEAARISLGLQERRNFHPYDHYRACLAAGVVGMMEIEKVVTDAGLQVVRTVNTVGEVSAIAALTFVRERLGALGLTRVLGILGRAWGRTPGSFASKMLKLCAMILAAYPGEVDDDRLAVTLSTRAPNLWLADTLSAKKHLGFIAQDVVMEYNKPLRANRIPEKTPSEYLAASTRTVKTGSSAHSGPGPRPKIQGPWRGRTAPIATTAA
jgi:hypothetical protein